MKLSVRSYRVFLWPSGIEGRPHVVALSQASSGWDPQAPVIPWSEFIASSDLIWIPFRSSISDSLSDLQAIWDTSSSIHVFASPEDLVVEESLPKFGIKKLLRIARNTQLKDYALLDRLFADAPLSPDTNLKLHQSRVAACDDREIEKRMRLLGDSPIFKLALEPNRYAKIFEKSRKPQKLLLHVCCGPDAAGVVRQLKSEFELSCFWYDPNIQPAQEHDKRLEAFVKVMDLEQIPYSVGEYDVQNFLDKISGLEHTPEQGAKCSKCYDMRLERAAFEAREKNFDLYATTLAISPHKVQQKLVAFGELNERRYGVPYFHRNFMKDEGFNDSVAYTKTHDIFRQDYCGCWFSLHEGGAAAKWLGTQIGLTSTAQYAPASITDELFKAYEERLSSAPESGYSGG